MEFTTVDILSMGASISTIAGLLIAIASLANYHKEKREELEYKVKKDFFDGDTWNFLSDDEAVNTFTLRINNAPFSQMSGEIEYLQHKDSDIIPIENFLFFEVLKSHKKEINLKIYKIINISEAELGEKTLGTATLKHINPYEFTITFNKDYLPKFPRTADLTCLEHYARITRERHKQRVERKNLSST